MEIWQNFVAFSEYMNFTEDSCSVLECSLVIVVPLIDVWNYLQTHFNWQELAFAFCEIASMLYIPMHSVSYGKNKASSFFGKSKQQTIESESLWIRNVFLKCTCFKGLVNPQKTKTKSWLGTTFLCAFFLLRYIYQ